MELLMKFTVHEHVVATLLTIQHNNFDSRLWYAKQIAENVFKHFEGVMDIKPKEKLNLEVIYYYTGSSYEFSSHLELKLGLDKLYVVKNGINFMWLKMQKTF